MGVCSSSDAVNGKFSDTVPRNRSEIVKYKEQGHAYFDWLMTKDEASGIIAPRYSHFCIRWEWEPWLLLTGKNAGADVFTALDALQSTIIPCGIPVQERYCRVFPKNPFCRMMVKFYYPDKQSDPSPTYIYEEFTFNSAGEIIFIEAWSYPESTLRQGGAEGYLVENMGDPVVASDCFEGKLTDADKGVFWPDQEKIYRLSTRIPGLGTRHGKPLVLKGNDLFGTELHPEMAKAIAGDSGIKKLQLFADKYSAPFSDQFDQEHDLAQNDPARSAYMNEMEPSLTTRVKMLNDNKTQLLINTKIYFNAIIAEANAI